MFPFSVTRQQASPPTKSRSGQPGYELITFNSEKLNVFSAEVRYCEPHWHPAPELILVLSGGFSISVNNHTQSFSTGDLLYINAEDIHSLQARVADSSLLTIQFSPLLFDEAHPAPKTNYSVEWRDRKHEDDRQVYRMIAHLVEDLLHLAPSFRRIATIYLLLDSLVKAGKPAPNNQILAHDLEMIKKSIEYINQHYEQELSLGLLADYSGVSYHYFSRMFKRVSNHNFKEYLTLTRVNKARQLLKDTSYPITEISHICGFREHKHLIVAFNKYCNMTPTEYRKHHLSDMNFTHRAVQRLEDIHCIPLSEDLLEQLKALSN
ncbi:AraC family transcriptional regulator [Chania multitudinisentens RB-25]|uniref:AraC family transcriptional regulator n=1 Tax=Chania multitudinisentens RB-25 TaxID=1441930 RepID=A0A0D4ZYG7_9GAMM|nr:AraC family transcriptional regulator [Chania multitudinisentens]AJW28911.1 AraC family transcriptional regulator [Chania multitudinisentens RB-25]